MSPPTGKDPIGRIRIGRVRPGRARGGRDRTGRARGGRIGPAQQAPPGADMLSDLQRWLIKSSARSMRKEISGQVRRTFGGGRSSNASDVWDTATTEIPPEVGESPECQWCPICRAARRMRDSGPGHWRPVVRRRRRRRLGGPGCHRRARLDSVQGRGGAARPAGARVTVPPPDAAAAAQRRTCATADAMGSPSLRSMSTPILQSRRSRPRRSR